MPLQTKPHVIVCSYCNVDSCTAHETPSELKPRISLSPRARIRLFTNYALGWGVSILDGAYSSKSVFRPHRSIFRIFVLCENKYETCRILIPRMHYVVVDGNL
jgi:hypothetical protein